MVILKGKLSGACLEACEFASKFDTLEAAIAACNRLDWLEWAVEQLPISKKDLDEYQAIEKPALEKYLKIEKKAREEYVAIERQAFEEYQKIQNQSWNEYQKTILDPLKKLLLKHLKDHPEDFY